MKIYSLRKLVEIARKKSTYYKRLYKNISTSRVRLADLPILDEEEFWKANSHKSNHVLTELVNGVFLRTGGTAGNPKISVFSYNEWRTFAQIMVSKLLKANLLRNDDCVANLFAFGSLYGGFLFIHEMLQQSQCRLLELPIGIGPGSNIEDTVALIKTFKANVIMSTPYMLVSIASYVKSKKIKDVNITRFLYGADMLLESQYQFIKSVFPKATISSSGYASTDAGFLGYADSTCQMNEYRTDNRFTIAEIVDEKTGHVIEKEGIKGRLIVTNLTKTLMPVIRYPAGDLAMWCEPKGHKFRKLKLMERHTKKDDRLVFAGKEYDYHDFYNVLKTSRFHTEILGFQILEGKNGTLTIKVACYGKNSKKFVIAKKEIKDLFVNSIPGINARLFEVEFVDIFELKFTPRTYKAIKIIRE